MIFQSLTLYISRLTRSHCRNGALFCGIKQLRHQIDDFDDGDLSRRARNGRLSAKYDSFLWWNIFKNNSEHIPEPWNIPGMSEKQFRWRSSVAVFGTAAKVFRHVGALFFLEMQNIKISPRDAGAVKKIFSTWSGSINFVSLFQVISYLRIFAKTCRKCPCLSFVSTRRWVKWLFRGRSCLFRAL